MGCPSIWVVDGAGSAGGGIPAGLADRGSVVVRPQLLRHYLAGVLLVLVESRKIPVRDLVAPVVPIPLDVTSPRCPVPLNPFQVGDKGFAAAAPARHCDVVVPAVPIGDRQLGARSVNPSGHVRRHQSSAPGCSTEKVSTMISPCSLLRFRSTVTAPTSRIRSTIAAVGKPMRPSIASTDGRLERDADLPARSRAAFSAATRAN